MRLDNLAHVQLEAHSMKAMALYVFEEDVAEAAEKLQASNREAERGRELGCWCWPLLVATLYPLRASHRVPSRCATEIRHFLRSRRCNAPLTRSSNESSQASSP